jgi:putative transcriptional regulator
MNGAMESLRSQLLVASPQLGDPNFARTVVLITEHNDEGAMGVILNRPATTTVSDAAPELENLVEAGDDVFVGGPVQPSSVIVLAEWDEPDEVAVPIFDGIGFVGANSDPEELARTVNRARVFAGFAGWAPGQLESEIERDDWILEPALPEDVFSADPEQLWSEVLERKGGEYALVARMPLDPSLN